MAYVGRFAPSPTGPLHFGSLVAALASFLDARAQQGSWLVRIEDLDPPREVPGAAALILQALHSHGLEWDGEPLYQSQRTPAYQAAIAELRCQHLLYPCTCSRKMLNTPIYPGTCRDRQDAPTEAAAWRLKVAGTVNDTDRLFGPQQQHLPSSVGDYVVWRKDGLFAYQLAVVVDDIFQGITQVVRGSDLLSSTPQQIYLHRLLGQPAPQFGHIPVVVNRAGRKLSKQHCDAPLVLHAPTANLFRALQFLQQAPPAELLGAPVAELLHWAVAHWQWQRIPASETLPAPQLE